ncbi:hypothetical protein EI94DRAFT_1751005 [Lactarius quietus]|nr:hypothetical protein EI94DRAFT_1751005 [Lactarius quietus]
MHTPPFCLLVLASFFLFAIRSSAPHARFALCMSSFGDPLPTYLVLSLASHSNTTPTSGNRFFFSYRLPPIVVLSRKPPKKN